MLRFSLEIDRKLRCTTDIEPEVYGKEQRVGQVPGKWLPPPVLLQVLQGAVSETGERSSSRE